MLEFSAKAEFQSRLKSSSWDHTLRPPKEAEISAQAEICHIVGA